DGIRDFHVTGVQTCALPICDVNAHQKVWNAKPEDERKTLSLSASAWAIKQTGHRVKCPACASDALINGEPVATPHKTIRDDEIRSEERRVGKERRYRG